MLKRGHRPSSSLTGLLVAENEHDNINDEDDSGEKQPPRPGPHTTNSSNSIGRRLVSESVATTTESQNALFPLPLSFAPFPSEKQQQQRPQHRTVSLCIFVASLLCFSAITLALGLGLGLGLSSSRWRHDKNGNNDNNNNNNVVYGPLLPPSNYSTYYGVSLPTDMEVIPIERLVNMTELDLDTGFVVEAVAEQVNGRDALEVLEEAGTVKVREYTFDVTQGLAAPDGFQKPMILVNGQSPGPLIEANTGDVVRVRVNNRLKKTTRGTETTTTSTTAETASVVAADSDSESSDDDGDGGGGGGGGDSNDSNRRSGKGEGEGEGDNAAAAVTVHWHGIDQHGTPWMDGVAGVSQCGIPAGSSFTYEFRVTDQRGTFWWHAHLSVQYSDGVYGPIVIHDLDEMIPETDDEKIIFVSDVYHTYGSVLLDSYLRTTSKWAPNQSGVEPLPDNMLLNGRNTYDCSIVSTTYPPPSNISPPPACNGGQLYTTKVQPGSTVRLRLINASSFLSYWVSVDNHTLTVVELDGVEVEPFVATSNGGVYLNIGQRVSVVLTANQTAGNYAIRATLPRTCFLPYAPYESAGLRGSGGDGEGRAGGQINGTNTTTTTTTKRPYEVYGILSYDDVDPAAPPIGRPGNTTNPYGVGNNGARGDVWEGCDDAPFDMPHPVRVERAVEVSEANTHYIEYMFRQAQDVNRIFINKTAYSPLAHNATLWKAVEQRFATDAANSYNSWDFGLSQQVLLVPDAGKGVQIVINSRDNMEHPWHLHGHTFQIVGWGAGLYGAGDGATTWNLENPMRRDTVTIPAYSHIVIRFVADNPGLWALHCHVAWHMEGGMFVSIAERPDDLVELVNNMDPETKRLSQSFCGTE